MHLASGLHFLSLLVVHFQNLPLLPQEKRERLETTLLLNKNKKGLASSRGDTLDAHQKRTARFIVSDSDLKDASSSH